MRKDDENYYDLLKVDPRATVAEIVSAYHAAKNAFSKDSVATYSLFDAAEAEQILEQLEEAYLTLSNLERRAEYDRRLTSPEEPLNRPVGMSPPALAPEVVPVELAPPPPSESPVVSASIPTQNQPASESAAQTSAEAPSVVESAPPPVAAPEEWSGTYFRDLRTQRGLSVEDVCRITKIPTKFLKAIEEDDFKRLPARVYIQGFIKNLGVLYKVDSKSAALGYLTYLDRMAPAA